MHTLTRRSFLPLLAATVASGARADDLQEVTVGCIQLPTNAPLYIAIDRGLFAKAGIRIKLVWFTAAATVFSAVVSRDVDIGMTSSTAATFNLAAKGGFKVIAGTTWDAPGFPLNGFLVSNAAYDKGFRGIAGMGGRRIAITTAGSTHQYYVGAMAKKYDIPLASIAVVPLEAYGNIIAALESGQVDGAFLPPAQTQRVLDAKGAHFIAWTGDEVPMQQGVLVASPQTLASKRDLMLGFMESYVAGVKLYHRAFNQRAAAGQVVRGPDAPALIEIIARFAAVQPADLERQIAYIQPDSRPDEVDILKQIRFWQDQGMVTKNFDFTRMFDLSFLPPG